MTAEDRSLRPAAILLALLLAGCAPRAAEPVAMAQSGDLDLTCQQLEAEMLRNAKEAAALAGTDDRIKQENEAKTVVGVMVAPVLLTVDLSDAEQVRYRALWDRNENLGRLRRNKECVGAGPPERPPANTKGDK